MTLELGGNITLDGFGEQEFTELIVVKKMVGQYARKLTDSSGLEALKIAHQDKDGKITIAASAIIGGEEFQGNSVANNLYVALDDSLKQINNQLRK